MNITKLHIEDLKHKSAKFISNTITIKQYDNEKEVEKKTG